MASEIDVSALIERLRKPLGAHWLGAAFWVSDDRADELCLERREAADALAAQAAELEQMRADVERVDWLAANPREATIRIGAEIKACVFYGVSCDPRWSVREAIDAARAQEKS